MLYADFNTTRPSRQGIPGTVRDILIYTMIGMLLLAFSSFAQTPGSWPGASSLQWVGYTWKSGFAIADQVGDQSPTMLDVVFSTQDSTSVKIASDGTNLFFRLQMAINPTDAANGGFKAMTWMIMMYDRLYRHRMTIGLDGKNSQTADFVYTSDNTGNTYSTVYTWPVNGTNAMRGLAVPGHASYYYLDFQVPISSVATYWTGFTADTTFIPIFGTSNTANQRHSINKDNAFCSTNCTIDASLLSQVPSANALSLQLNLLPVEMVSFAATRLFDGVVLKWVTATEVENLGFEIQCSQNGEDWELLDFVNGRGTVSTPSEYTYLHHDASSSSSLLFYRLKQIDRDGSFAYSDIVSVHNHEAVPATLSQNYPNPFGATRSGSSESTTIEFELTEAAMVRLAVYNVLGQEVAVLQDGNALSGRHWNTFSPAGLPPGIYMYALTVNEHPAVRRNMLYVR